MDIISSWRNGQRSSPRSDLNNGLMTLTWRAVESRWEDDFDPSLSLSRGESHHHSDPVDRSLSGWLVVDQLYRKNLVNFVSTSTGYCTANHWPVSLVTRILLVPTLRSNNAPGDDTMGRRMTLMKVTSRMFTGIPASFSIASPIECPIEISYSTDIFAGRLDHLRRSTRIRHRFCLEWSNVCLPTSSIKLRLKSRECE